MTLLAAAIAIAAIVVGCGGGGDSSSSSGGESDGSGSIKTSLLSKPVFIKKASEACRKKRTGLIQRIIEYQASHEVKGAPEGALIAKAIKAVQIPTVESEMEAIRALGAPSGDEAEIEAILAAHQAAIDELRKAKQINDYEEVEKYFADATKKLEAYGFKACANGG
ncbi:MAG TPA: hypothetical protein VK471_02395 [Solirubrobacterales bacterium]|nr:hypothetical protein [Solirubrobacterales bacterium]